MPCPLRNESISMPVTASSDSVTKPEDVNVETSGDKKKDTKTKNSNKKKDKDIKEDKDNNEDVDSNSSLKKKKPQSCACTLM